MEQPARKSYKIPLNEYEYPANKLPALVSRKLVPWTLRGAS